MRYIILFIVIVLTSGCDNSQISAVKDSYIDGARTMATSQFLDNRKICQDVSWKSYEDQHKRTIVEYQCTFGNSKDFLSARRESYVNRENINLSSRLEDIKEAIKSTENAIEDLKSNGERKIEDKHKEYQNESFEEPEHLIRLKRVSGNLDKVRNSYNDRDYIDFLMGEDFTLLIRVFGSKDYLNQTVQLFKNSVPVLSSQVNWMRRVSTAAGQEKYKKDNVDVHLVDLRKNIDNLGAYLNRAIEAEIEALEQKKLNYTAQINSSKEESFEDMKEDIAIKSNALNKHQESIKAIEEEIKGIRAKADKKFPIFEKIVESFQWVVNKEKIPTIVYGEVVAVSSESDKNVVLFKHNDPEQVLLIASGIDTDSFDEYIKEFAAIDYLSFLNR